MLLQTCAHKSYILRSTVYTCAVYAILSLFVIQLGLALSHIFFKFPSIIFRSMSTNKDVKSLGVPNCSTADCLHPNWKIIDKNEGADGIRSVHVHHTVCSLCSKVLAEEQCCISAHTYLVEDHEWGKRNNIEEFIR
jgi:hypothetical protein